MKDRELEREAIGDEIEALNTTVIALAARTAQVMSLQDEVAELKVEVKYVETNRDAITVSLNDRIKRIKKLEDQLDTKRSQLRSYEESAEKSADRMKYLDDQLIDISNELDKIDDTAKVLVIEDRVRYAARLAKAHVEQAEKRAKRRNRRAAKKRRK